MKTGNGNGNQEENEDIYFARDNDQDINWAMKKAGLTIGYFFDSLRSPREDQQLFSVKMKIVAGDNIEHIWLNEPGFDGSGKLIGTVNNRPLNTEKINLGDTIEIPLNDISDWMIVEDGRLIGGYTIRAYRTGLTDAEKVKFDNETGLLIDAGVDHFPHEMTTPEGAILCLEDAYTAKDIDAAVACKDFEAEARMMLSQFQDMGIDEEIIQNTAETMKLAFQQFMLESGFPDYRGAERAYPRRDWVDEETVIITEICKHSDGDVTMDRLLVFRSGDEWRVGPPANEEELN